jgi:WD40 repeat protein
MQSRRLQTLKSRLYGSFPLVGGWLQTLAARSLARQASPAAYQVLAEALNAHPNPSVRQIAKRAIAVLQQGRAIDAVCEVWTRTRNAWLGELIRQRQWVAAAPPQARVYSALQCQHNAVLENIEAEGIPALLESCHDSQPQFAALAQASLQNLKKQEAIDALCARWVESRQPWLESVILHARYRAIQPVEVRVLSALKNGAGEWLRQQDAEIVPALLNACQDRDEQIANLAQQAAASLESQAAREAVCRQVIAMEDAHARRAADLGGYLPENLHQRAVYLFITEQWQAYQALDFDHRLLRSAYEAAGMELRRRMMEKIRAAGRSDLLTVITGRDLRSRLAVLAPDEANFIVQMLAENQEWAALWGKALELSPAVGQRILQILTQNGWRPPAGDENRLYEELASLAAHPAQITPETARRHLPLAVPRARARVVSTRINDLAFAPAQPILALGTSGRKVGLWNFQRGEREGLLDRAFAHAIGKVAFTQNGDLYFAERTNGRASCSLYRLEDGRTQQIWKQWGSITALAPVRESQILLAGRDQQVALLEPGASQAATHSRTFPFWTRDAAVSADGRRAALVYDGTTLVSLPDLEPLPQLSKELSRVTRVAAFAPDDRALLLGRYNGEVRVLRFSQQTLERRPLVHHSGRVEGIACLKRQGITISAGSDGGVHFVSWADRAPLGKIQASAQQITALRVSPDEAFMALGAADATISLWDLRPLEVPDLFARPLALDTPNHLAALRLLLDQPQLPVELQQAMRYIERVLRFRFRFDVEVSEAPQILAGDFEIELG